ncbi:MAG: asparagine synthase-related protein [Erythrobacter sp.]
MTTIAAIFIDHGVSKVQLDAMLASMNDRPSDASGTLVNGATGLGATVLNATAEACEAEQPWVSTDNQLAVVIDGYLTNYHELRSELLACGALLRNRSDAELVLKAYEKWGDDCVRHIDGEFAFVIADQRKRRVFCARDHQGLRPLFYHHDGSQIFIASEVSAIIAVAGDRLRPDYDYLAGVMAGQWYNREATVWSGVKRLLPAHTLSFDGNSPSSQEYWSLQLGHTIRYSSDEEYAEHYREMLFDCVRRASRTHAPLAFGVSGGLDSSALYCAAHKLLEKGELAAQSMRGYTLAGAIGTPADEISYARAAAAHVGDRLSEIPLTEPSIDWYTGQAQTTCDLPIPTNGVMTFGLEQRAAEDGCRVVIGGSGGDEWLQGTSHLYRGFLAEGDFRSFWHYFGIGIEKRGFLGTLNLASRQSLMALAPQMLASRLRKWRRSSRRKGAAFWLNKQSRIRLARIEEDYHADMPINPVEWSKTNLLRSPFSDLAYCMMRSQYSRSGLEPRYPMLARQFIEFSAATPENTRHRAGQRKFLHRLAMKGILPDVILNRETKAEFPAYRAEQEFAEFVQSKGDDLLSEVIDADGLERLLNSFGNGNASGDWSWEIWGIYASAAFLYHNHR